MRKFDGTNRDQLIASYAYQLWYKRGRPIGSPEVDWFAAEKAIDAEYSILEGDIPYSNITMGPDEGPWKG